MDFINRNVFHEHPGITPPRSQGAASAAYGIQAAYLRRDDTAAGHPGAKKTHPWTGLKPCPNCDGGAGWMYPVWLVGRDGQRFESGAPYVVKCRKCKTCTAEHDDWEGARNEWNAIPRRE